MQVRLKSFLVLLFFVLVSFLVTQKPRNYQEKIEAKQQKETKKLTAHTTTDYLYFFISDDVYIYDSNPSLEKSLRDYLGESTIFDEILKYQPKEIILFLCSGGFSSYFCKTYEEMKELYQTPLEYNTIKKFYYEEIDEEISVTKHEFYVVKQNHFPEVRTNLQKGTSSLDPGITIANIKSDHTAYNDELFKEDFIDVANKANKVILTFPVSLDFSFTNPSANQEFDKLSPFDFLNKYYSLAPESRFQKLVDELKKYRLPSGKKIFLAFLPVYNSSDPRINNQLVTTITPYYLEVETKNHKLPNFSDFTSDQSYTKYYSPFYYEFPNYEFATNNDENKIFLKAASFNRFMDSSDRTANETLTTMVNKLAENTFPYTDGSTVVYLKLKPTDSQVPVTVADPSISATQVTLFLASDLKTPVLYTNANNLKKAKKQLIEHIKSRYEKTWFRTNPNPYLFSGNNFKLDKDNKLQILYLSHERFQEVANSIFPNGSECFSYFDYKFKFFLKPSRTKQNALDLEPKGFDIDYNFAINAEAFHYQTNIPYNFRIRVLPGKKETTGVPRLFQDPDLDERAQDKDHPLTVPRDYLLSLTKSNFLSVELTKEIEVTNSEGFTSVESFTTYYSPYYPPGNNYPYDYIINYSFWDLSSNPSYLTKWTYSFKKPGKYYIRLANFQGQISSTYYIMVIDPIPNPTVKEIVSKVPDGNGGTFDKIVAVELNVPRPVFPNKFISFTVTRKIGSNWVELEEDDEHNFLRGYGKYRFKKEGEYRVLWHDFFDVLHEYTFEVNLSAPFGSLYKMVNGEHRQAWQTGDKHNGTFYLMWPTSFPFSATIYKDEEEPKPLEPEERIRENGMYKIVLFDRNNPNKKIAFEFEIFKTDLKTEIKNKASGAEITHKKKQGDIVYFRHNDSLKLILMSTNERQTFKIVGTKRNKATGESLPVAYPLIESSISEVFTEEAFYTITITDNFNNVVTVYFEIDKTPPKLLFFSNENNEPIKNTAFIDDKLVKVTNKSFYFASNKDFTTFKVIYEDEQEKECEPNLVIYNPGKYVVRVTDDLGLTFQSTIIYNNQVPTPTIFFNNEEKLLVNKYDSIYDYKKHLGYVPSVPLRTNKSFTFLELKKIHLEKVTYKIGSGKDATEYTLNYKDDPKDELTFVNENDYSFALTDVFGNVSEFKITLDKTPPKYRVTGLNKDNKSSSKVTFTWEEYSAVATLFNLTTGKEREIYSDHSVHQEGEYLFTLMDDVGNFVTRKFTIDYFAPEPTIFTNLEAVVKKELFALGKYKTNKNVSIIIPGEPKFQTFKYFLNEKEMTASEINNYQVSEEGVYTFKYITSYDAIGSLTFEIDRTPPVYEVMGLIKPGVPRSNSFVSFFWEEKEASGFLRNLNDPDNQVSYTKETKIYANGEYEFTLVDEVGNATEYIFAINNTLLDPTVFTNLKEVVKPEFFNKKIYQTNKNVKLILLPEHRLYLDGKQVLEPIEIKNPGTYKLGLENGFDLSTEIEFTIKTEPPVFKAFGLNTSNRSNVYVKFEWGNLKDKGTITNQNGELVKEIQSGDKFYQKGKYIFTLTDELDNKSELEFQILSLEPVLTLKDKDGSAITKEYLNEPVYIHKEFDHLRYYVNGIEITKFPYVLETDGKYLIASKNEFDEQAIRHVAIKRSIGEIIPSVLETKTNRDISFRFNQDEITLTVRDVIYKANEPYYYEGTTTFEFSDIYGNKKEYTVTQRRTLPDIYLLVLNENGEETSKLLENDLKLFEPFRIKEEEGIKTYVNSSLSETGYYEESKDYQVTVYDEFGNQREYVFSANLVKSKNTENYRYNKVMLIIFLLFLTTALTIFGLIKFFNFKRNPFTKRKFRKIKETAVLPQNEES